MVAGLYGQYHNDVPARLTGGDLISNWVLTGAQPSRLPAFQRNASEDACAPVPKPSRYDSQIGHYRLPRVLLTTAHRGHNADFGVALHWYL
jgi:hypothetical protein